MSGTVLVPTSLVHTQDLINGHREPPSVTLDSWVCNPNTGEALHPVLESSSEQIEQAFNAASKAASSSTWADLPKVERATLLEIGRAHV